VQRVQRVRRRQQGARPQDASLGWLYVGRRRPKDQIEAAAAEVDNIIFAGDINLDAARGNDKKYVRRCLLLAHDNAIAEANMRYLTTGVMYKSHDRHEREDGEARAHESVLDHVYVTRDLEAMVAVFTDLTTNHFPVVAAVKVNKVAPTLKIMKRRNFKTMEKPALLQALDVWPWSDVYGIRDPDKVLDFITRGIVNSLDQAAPVKSITVREVPCLPAPRYAPPDGQEGFPRPRPQVQSGQEQGNHVGQAGQGGLQPDQAGGVRQLPSGTRQASPASADVGHEGGWHADGGKPRNCEYHH
jgi:hypothetical protein